MMIGTRTHLLPRTGVVLASSLLALSALVLATTLLLGRPDLTLFSLVIVVPFLLAAIGLLTNRSIGLHALPAYAGAVTFWHFLLLNTMLFGLSLTLLQVASIRPFAYFVVISLYAGVVLVQITMRRPEWTDGLILVETVALSLNLAWGMVLKYPLYFGDTDLLVHLNLIDNILRTGHVAYYYLDYRHYPLYHILAAMGIEFTGGPTTTVMFVVMGLAWQVGVLFSYLIFRSLTESKRLALIGCLLFAVSSPVIFYGSYSIARSLAFVFFIGWLYMVIKAQRDTRYLLPALLLMGAMIGTHHLNVLYAFPILLTVLVSQILIRRFMNDHPLEPLFFYLLTIGSFSYLMWVASDMATDTIPVTIRNMLNSDFNIKSGFVLTQGFGLSVIIGTLYYSFALLLCLFGLKVLVDHIAFKRKIPGTYALSGFVVLLAYVPGFLYLFPFSDILLTERVSLVASPFVVLLMSYGMGYLLTVRPPRVALVRSAVPAVGAAFVVVSTFFSVISIGNAKDTNYLPHTANVDSPYFSNAEVASFGFLSSRGNAAEPLFSDYATSRNDYSLFPFERVIITDFPSIEDGYVLLRTTEMVRKQSLGFLPEGKRRDTIIRYPLERLRTDMSMLADSPGVDYIYSNADVQIFVLHRAGAVAEP